MSILSASLAFALTAAPGAHAKVAKKKPATAAPEPPAQCYAEFVADLHTGKVLHAHNAEAPILPASVAKIILGLLVNDAVIAGKTDWNKTIPVPMPPPFDPKRPKASSIHATICHAHTIGAHGTTPITVRDAFDNAQVTSNLYTTIGLERHLTAVTGTPYADLARAKLAAIGANNSVIIEPSGLSNAALCLDERRKPHEYATHLERKIASGDADQLPPQNRSTAVDMAQWVRAALGVPAMVQTWRERFVTFLGERFRNSNPFMRPAHAAATPPDTGGKTGFTATAGGTFAGATGNLVITVAGCANTRTRDARLAVLKEQFAASAPASGTIPNLDIYRKISDSRSASGPHGPAMNVE